MEPRATLAKSADQSEEKEEPLRKKKGLQGIMFKKEQGKTRGRKLGNQRVGPRQMTTLL